MTFQPNFLMRMSAIAKRFFRAVNNRRYDRMAHGSDAIASPKVDEGAQHGLPLTHIEKLNEDLQAFISA